MSDEINTFLARSTANHYGSLCLGEELTPYLFARSLNMKVSNAEDLKKGLLKTLAKNKQFWDKIGLRIPPSDMPPEPVEVFIGSKCLDGRPGHSQGDSQALRNGQLALTAMNDGRTELLRL